MPRELLNVLPKSWSQQQCVNCGMVFALPSIRNPSGVRAKDVLREELERHLRQTHEPDFVSDWNAEH
jgi:hypothetical protein